MCRAVESAFARVLVFDADKDEPLVVKLLRSGKHVRLQTLHSDFPADSIERARPQRSAMLVLKNNTYIMLADGSAVVAHR